MVRLLTPGLFHACVIPEYKIQSNGDTLSLSGIRRFSTDEPVTSNDFVLDGTWYDILPALVNVNRQYSNDTCKYIYTFKPNNTYCWKAVFTNDSAYTPSSYEDIKYNYDYPYLYFENGSKVRVIMNGDKMTWVLKERKFIKQN